MMSSQMLSEGGWGMGDGYTSLFTGHFLWLCLGNIICPQTNKHSRVPKAEPFFFLQQVYTSHLPLLKLQSLIIAISSCINTSKIMQAQLGQAKMQFYRLAKNCSLSFFRNNTPCVSTIHYCV